jgi:hypothetical protein
VVVPTEITMEFNDTLSLVIIIGSRLLVPLLILRWPFWGSLACILADGGDTMVPEALGSDVIEDQYHNVDKAFDTYYLAVQAFVASRWVDILARNTALVLFALRFAAVVVYEVTGWRGAFLVGPNVFELFFLWVAAGLTADPAYRIGSLSRLALILAVLVPPKLLQEYVMHYMESQTWHFVRDNLLPWP